MYILSGSLTSFVCAASPAHPRPRSARPRLAEPSPHSGGALGNTARTPRRRDWTDGDDWQRPGPRDWLPFRPRAQRGSAPAAPRAPPRRPPKLHLQNLARARRGAPGASPAAPRRRLRAAPAPPASAPRAPDGPPRSGAPPCLRLRGRGVSPLAWRRPTLPGSALGFLSVLLVSEGRVHWRRGGKALPQAAMPAAPQPRGPRPGVPLPRAPLGEGGQSALKRRRRGLGFLSFRK